MAKKLILVRHAKSDWSDSGQRDFDRPLNERGHRDAPRMGRLLAEKGIKIDMMVSSPAERAKLTAMYFGEQLKIDASEIVLNENLYDASARIWMNEVNQLDDNIETYLMFGHNPGISYFAEYISKSEMGEVPTCAIIGIEFEIDSWKEVSASTGKIIFYDFPKNNIEPTYGEK